jgi:hypothetical protein
MRGALVHRSGPRSDEVRVSVILEGLLALVALVVVVGALVGALTWGLVRLMTVVAG